jgi:hypothetical protein
MHSLPDPLNRLIVLPVLSSPVSLDSLIESDYLEASESATKHIEYVPGAIGLSLLSPLGSGRSFLPACLRLIDREVEWERWWMAAAPLQLLERYNGLVKELRASMSEREKMAVDPSSLITVN